VISNKLARELVQEFGTPLYVYDLDDVHKRSSALRALLPCGARLFYSMKANPLSAVAAAARLAGTSAEISSEGELEAAIDAGFAPAAMVYTGPAKTESELRRAVNEGVGCFSAESLRDLRRIAEVARKASTTAHVILRINPLVAPRTRLAMTGVPSQFGFEEAELESLSDRIFEVGDVEVSGVHVYLGTQATDADALAGVFQIAVDVAERLAKLFPIRIMNLGGGFPWPFASSDAAPNLEPLAQSLAAILSSRDRSSNADLWFESGRYIAASCGTMVARVVDVKHSRGTTFYVLDAGVATLGGMSGLGRVLRPTVSLTAVDREASINSELADIVGPLCTPLDCLASGARVPAVQPGELVAIPNVGAYGATASLTGFLSRPTALEVSLRDGEVVDVARLRYGHEPLRQAVGVT
jgi:diaminopimelate decarboxylase